MYSISFWKEMPNGLRYLVGESVRLEKCSGAGKDWELPHVLRQSSTSDVRFVSLLLHFLFLKYLNLQRASVTEK